MISLGTWTHYNNELNHLAYRLDLPSSYGCKFSHEASASQLDVNTTSSEHLPIELHCDLATRPTRQSLMTVPQQSVLASISPLKLLGSRAKLCVVLDAGL